MSTLCPHDFALAEWCPMCLRAEVERLKRGEFTPDELQNLCHNLSADDACAFLRGCRAYQLQLFGRDKVKTALDQLYEEWIERNRCRECNAWPDASGLIEHLRQCSQWETRVEELAP